MSEANWTPDSKLAVPYGNPPIAGDSAAGGAAARPGAGRAGSKADGPQDALEAPQPSAVSPHASKGSGRIAAAGRAAGRGGGATAGGAAGRAPSELVALRNEKEDRIPPPIGGGTAPNPSNPSASSQLGPASAAMP
eukprot:scaffold16770_cov90-Isochrysis_galbana.AAC.1